MNQQITKLITHARPHMDDVTAVWLLKRFYPPYRDLSLDFVPVGDPTLVIPSDAVAVGIGRGQFDEHKGDIGECATTLVWKWLKEQPEAQIADHQKKAVQYIVDWAHQEDMGHLNSAPWRGWSVALAIETYWQVTKGDNQAVYDLAEKILDALLVHYSGVVQLNLVWDQRIEFETKWGKAIAIKTSAGGVSQRAYSSGAVIVVQIDPANGSRQFRADAEKNVDFSQLYEKVRAMEPEASWFLHHAKGLLLCGSRSTPTFTPSNLTLEQMVDLIKSN